MNILRRVPNSVLWLVADTPLVRENLFRYAEQPASTERLIFNTRALPAEYLARYRMADLFLDTFPFNAGTTASDALWAGLPLLTCAGQTFASRMAGSLLRAVDLPQLITTNFADYEERRWNWPTTRTHRRDEAQLKPTA
jgi:predicted O-linked N-acetylglucosamine transferase (SPINDLY family)